ncbi:hypothetical protein ACJX0J_017145, partial [Zea mays]
YKMDSNINIIDVEIGVVKSAACRVFIAYVINNTRNVLTRLSNQTRYYILFIEEGEAADGVDSTLPMQARRRRISQQYACIGEEGIGGWDDTVTDDELVGVYIHLYASLSFFVGFFYLILLLDVWYRVLNAHRTQKLMLL